VFLVLDVYPLHRFAARTTGWFEKSMRPIWFEKLPFLILAITAAAVAIAAKESTAAILGLDSYGWAFRAGQACYGLLFYLSKTVLPVGLSPLYQLTPEFGQQTLQLVWLGLAVTTLTAGLFVARQRSPALLAGWLCYGAILAPVLGILQSGPQITADRYSYLACAPWAVIAAAGLHRLAAQRHLVDSTARTPVTFILGITLVIVLGVLSWQQTQHWKNSATLWQRVLNTDPDSTIGHHNLGNYLVDQGKLEEARMHYLKAIAIDPTYAQAHVNLGMVLSRQNKLKESMAHIRLGLQNDPGNWGGHHALGIDFAILGAWQQAAEQFRKALELAPHQSGIHFDLARVLIRQGKIDEAIQHLEEAIRLEPDSLPARRELIKLMDMKLNGR
jgi:protein O-mannosyl-transferase